jgi:hypothetical protein
MPLIQVNITRQVIDEVQSLHVFAEVVLATHVYRLLQSIERTPTLVVAVEISRVRLLHSEGLFLNRHIRTLCVPLIDLKRFLFRWLIAIGQRALDLCRRA